MNTAIPAQGSVLETVKKRRQQFQGDRSEFFAIPGYDGLLLAEYKPMTVRSLKKVSDRAEKTLKHDPDRDLLVTVDALIDACQGVHLVAEDGTRTELASGYTTALAEQLEIESEDDLTARAIFQAVFPSDLAIAEHADEILAWSRDGSVNDDESLVGE